MDSWTKEEEAALQSAYYEVKPSANFWLDIARKVPGRTAKECFDKHYSAFPTPPQLRRASRRRSPAKGAEELVAYDSETEDGASGNRQRKRKPTLSRSRKIVREMMRQQRIAEEGFEADEFAALECIAAANEKQTLRPVSSTRLNVPGLVQQPGKGKGSRIAVSHQDVGQHENRSPEVLKRTVNHVQLDRYIDLLHHRKKQDMSLARAASKRPRSGASNRIVGKDFHSLVEAKCAVISTAEEVLRQCSKLEGPHCIDHTFDEDSGDDISLEARIAASFL